MTKQEIELFREVLELAEDGSNYKGDHLREKHGDQGTIDKARTFLAAVTEKVADVAPVADRDAVLFGILMRRNIELTDEAYLSMRVVGVPPSEDEFVAALKKAIDAAIESQRGDGL